MELFFAGTEDFWTRDTETRYSRVFCVDNNVRIFVSQQFLSHELPSGVFMIVAVVLLILSILLYNKSLFLSNSITKMLEPLVWFAIISYPFYLLHQNIGFVIIRWLESVGFASEFWLIIPFALITGLACLLHKYVEKPMSSLPRN